MKTPFISIVIPAYNASKTAKDLLDSIFRSNYRSVEVVFVDDNSFDNTKEIVKKYGDRVRYFCLPRKSGPAEARNTGAKKARGEVLLFLDSDVVLFPETLKEVADCFKNDPDLNAMTGVWDKKQKSNSFFPKFKALRDWSYWINEKDQKGYYYLFSTRIAAIRRELFLRLGGFDNVYSGAMVEDIELTYRIARRYAVVFNPKMRVAHEFEGFWPIAKKYYLRSYQWCQLYSKRGKFDPVATTPKEAITSISAGGTVGSLLLLILVLVFAREITILRNGALGVFALFFLIHLWGVRKFLWFVTREEGIVFGIKSFFVGIALYLFIIAGAGKYFLKKLVRLRQSMRQKER